MSTTPMPSPAAAAAPAPVTDAPVAAVVSDAPPDTAAAPLDLLTVSDDQLAARYAIPKEEAEPEVVIARDPAPASEPEAVAPEPAPEAPAAPEAAEGTKPITQFALYDGEGEVDVPPLFVSFKAGGKEYEKVPLDKVVRMAQSAPLADRYREAAEQLPTVQDAATQLKTSYDQLAADMAQNNALYERLLNDPDLYVQAVERFQQLQSPEARALRAEQETQALRTQQQQYQRQAETQQAMSAAGQFAATRIAPVVTALAEQYTGLLDLEELTDRFHTLTADLLESGPTGKPWVPPSKLPEVERRVQTDLTQWAAAKASSRRASHTSATQQAATDVQRAQTDAQMAKRQLARATAPARTPIAPDVPREKPIRTAQDAVDASLERVRRQVTQGG